jgi:putative endonuclease
MSYYVYLLVSNHKSKLISYVGYTNDLKKRVNLHNNSKGAKFTKGRFWKLAYFKKFLTKSAAMKEEHVLKKNYVLRSKIKKRFIKNENISTTTV